jgi:pyruvate,water dikinase
MSNATATETDSEPLVYTLASPATIPLISQVGGKGLSLIDCCAAGFPVPPGFVLSVAFFQSWLDSIKNTHEWNNFTEDPSKQACDVLKEACIKLQLDPKQEEALNTALQTNFGSTEKLLVAVRSSSPEEDLAQASFAGGYETTLGVTRDTLLDAIRTSFASALDFRVVQYKLQNGLDILKPKIAVVVQQQLDSDVSGVGFSLNPQNNCYDEAVISANFGLGETVVAGVVTPDTFVVDKVRREIISRTVSDKKQAYVLADGGGIREEENAEPTASSLTDDQVIELVSLITKVEEHVEKPVDIEWAYESDTLYLLQARPITVYLPLFPEMVTAPGEQKHLFIDFVVMTQGFSKPMSVLGLDIWGRILTKVQPFMPHGEDGVFWEIHGRNYFHVSNMLATPGGEAGIAQAFALHDGNTGRILETTDLTEYKPAVVTQKNKGMIWSRFKYLIRMLPSIFHGMWQGANAMDWYAEKANEFLVRFEPGGTEESNKTARTFSDEVNVADQAWEELMDTFGSLVASFYSTWRLQKMFDGDDDAKDLLVTLNMDLDANPTSEMGHLMVQLASFPDIRETETGEEFVQKVQNKAYSTEFIAAYNNYMHKFGCRGMMEIDIASSRCSEDPAAFFSHLKQIDIEGNQTMKVTERKEQAYQTLCEHAARHGKENKFKYHANVIQKVGGYREHGKYVCVFLIAYLRRRALALGKKWSDERRLDSPGQIFDLHIDDIAMGEQSSDLDLKEVARKNKAAYEAVANVSDWPTVIDSRGKIFRAPREDVDDGLGGDPISPGTVRGRAKVLKAPYEKPLESGEVLVTRATEPSWTPIFINAAAVVLEVGGPLQHGAIIAREYGIPCVSGVESATKVIKDGHLLEVDGTNGVVKIIEHSS